MAVSLASQHMTLHDLLGKVKHTDNKPGEKRIDPAHNQRLRNHHHHIPLHHPHHSLHARGVRHRICGRLAAVLGVLQEYTILVRGDEVAFAHLKGFRWEDEAIVAEVDAAENGVAFAGFGHG